MLLRQGLLEGTTVLAAPATALTDRCAQYGATVVPLEAPLLDEAAVEAAVVPCDTLVVDAASIHAEAGLRVALDSGWCVVRAVANMAFIARGRGGKVVLVAPRPGAGTLAEGLRSGLENLARVTSVEWSRHEITPTAVLPGPQTSDAEVAELVAYLASPAGDYFSGCRFDLQ
jgi:hypothetical protein